MNIELWRRQAVMWAQKQIGVGESGGQNCGVPSERYMRAPDGSFRCVPWCSYFAVWCYAQAGIHIPRNSAEWWKVGAVSFLQKLMARDGHRRRSDEKPLPGDIVIFDRRLASDAGHGMHCAIVEYVDDDNIVHTIDGNWGDSVARSSHQFGGLAIVGYFWE